MKKIYLIPIAAAVILFGTGCFRVGESYAILTHPGIVNSAPPSTAFLVGIPYLIGIIFCVTAAIIIYKKTNGRKKE
ncbi:MAG: hypothetical protein II820_00800 [Ruminiclostridium sp.]|nr:hypothetical protein [Ruminiclostridium sp.]